MKMLAEGERPLPDSLEIKASHIDFAIDVRKLSRSVECAVEVLKHIEFDALAFRGMSGALIATPLALRLNKSLILIRKPEDSSHSGMKAEGDKTARTYVIVDDFQSTGSTAQAIVEGVSNFASSAVFLGFLAVRRLHRVDFDIVKDPTYFLEDVERYRFRGGRRATLAKIEGKYRLTPESRMAWLEARAKATENKPEPKTTKTRYGFPYGSSKAIGIRYAQTFSPPMFGEASAVTAWMEYQDKVFQEAKRESVQKETVVKRRRVAKRSAMPRDTFGNPERAQIKKATFAKRYSR